MFYCRGGITSEDYDVQLLKESIPYRTLRASRSAKIALDGGLYYHPRFGNRRRYVRRRRCEEGYQQPYYSWSKNAGGNEIDQYLWPLCAFSKRLQLELDLPKGVQEINGADEARKAVREQLAHGADWIKIYADRGYYKLPDGSYRSRPNFTTEEIMAIGDETARSGKRWAAHAVARDGIIAAIMPALLPLNMVLVWMMNVCS